MPFGGPPTEEEIRTVARRTIDIIIESNITTNVYLFGSVASSLWADIGRVPNVRPSTTFALSIRFFRLKRIVFKTQDVDVVASEAPGLWEKLDAERIKEAIVGADGRYVLERSRKIGATHHILYFRLSAAGRRVKVDVLVPPSLGLPKPTMIYLINDFRVMPIFELLIMKTQGWWDHYTSHRADFRAKGRTDVTDIFALLERAVTEGASYADEADKLSREFISHALILVGRFVRVYGRHQQWRALQFPV
jgi:hypothetical protein